MRNFRFLFQWLVILLLSFNLQACGSTPQLPQATPTITLTNTLAPSPTSTLTFTPTLTSTPTPNATATERANRSDLMVQQIQKYVDLKYLSDSTGAYNEIPDFKQDFAQINWYQWWPAGFAANSFVVSAHFSWKTANSSPYISGCGLSLGTSSTYDNPQVFILHRSRVVVLDISGRESKTLKGTGLVDIQSPMEANFTLIVNESQNAAFVLVDDRFVGKYKLDRSGSVYLGYVIFSGTSKDFGTHCEITQAKAWKLK